VGQVLNWIWVLLAVWAFVHWLRCSSHDSSARRTQLFGLICVLTLLFPVISDKDDLLQQEALGTPASPVLKSFLKFKAACEDESTPAGSACRLLFPSWTAQELVAKDFDRFIFVPSLDATGDRSPPCIS